MMRSKANWLNLWLCLELKEMYIMWSYVKIHVESWPWQRINLVLHWLQFAAICALSYSVWTK